MHTRVEEKAFEPGTIRVEDPESGRFISQVAESTAEQIDAALAAGAAAVREVPEPAFERARILAEVADRVRGDAEAFARLIATEGIKTIREARSEVSRCATTLELSAEEATRIGGEVVPMEQQRSGSGKLAFTTRVAAGLVVAITPFNDPLNLVAHKIGPAVALGAPIVLKPHPRTPLSAIRLHRAFIDAGLAANRLQLVQGGSAAGAQLVRDSRPRIVSFTGGRAVGQSIAREAGFKKRLMELGGVGTVLVCADADLEGAANAIHAAAFAAAGQNCLHAQRIIVEKPVEAALTEMLLSRTAAMRLGPKLDETTDMGCCIDRPAAQRILELVRRSAAAGAELLAGGEAEGTRVEPTWLRTARSDDPLAMQEVFGPVSLIERAADFADMLSRLQSADDALHVSVFTASLDRAMAVYDRAPAGAVLVNESTDFRIDAMPFGGPGDAGMGREGVRYAIEAQSETRMLVIQRTRDRL